MGGLERCIATLANRLDRLAFQPTIVCLNRNGSAAPWVQAADVPFCELHKRAGQDPSLVWRLSHWLRRERIDLVHTHNWGTLMETCLARRWAGVSGHLHAEHGLELNDLQMPAWKKWLRKIATRWAYRRLDRVVTVSRALQERVQTELSCPPDKCEFISNGVESPSGLTDSSRSEIRAQLGLPRNAWMFGSVGRLAPIKHFDLALRALQRLRQQGTPAYFCLVGDGPERNALVALAEQLNVTEFVRFVGAQTNIGAWLSAFDVYLNCSLSEGMSLSIIEALAAGKPVVVTDVGESARLASETGLVVPSDDLTTLTDALNTMQRQPELCQRLSQRARETYLASFAPERMVAAYERAYRHVLRIDGEPRRLGASISE